MKKSDAPQRVRELPWTQPSDALRTRILSSGSFVSGRVTWSDRIWFSRTWRLAGAAAFVLLVGLEPVVDRFMSTTAPSPSRAFDNARRDDLQTLSAMADTGRRIGLPDDVMSSLTRRSAVGREASSAAEQESQHTLERELLGTQGDRQ